MLRGREWDDWLRSASGCDAKRFMTRRLQPPDAGRMGCVERSGARGSLQGDCCSPKTLHASGGACEDLNQRFSKFDQR